MDRWHRQRSLQPDFCEPIHRALKGEYKTPVICYPGLQSLFTRELHSSSGTWVFVLYTAITIDWGCGLSLYLWDMEFCKWSQRAWPPCFVREKVLVVIEMVSEGRLCMHMFSGISHLVRPVDQTWGRLHRWSSPVLTVLSFRQLRKIMKIRFVSNKKCSKEIKIWCDRTGCLSLDGWLPSS